MTIPEQVIGDLNAAAKAAGCKLDAPADRGRQARGAHFTEADYKTNPPTSGNHFPSWSEDGVYRPGATPTLGSSSTRSSTAGSTSSTSRARPRDTVDQLEALLAEQSDGYHMLLFENQTNMDAQIAATAWGHSLTCPEINNQVFDAIRTFRTSTSTRARSTSPRPRAVEPRTTSSTGRITSRASPRPR